MNEMPLFQLFCYEISPIDCWPGAFSAEELCEQARAELADILDADDLRGHVWRFNERLNLLVLWSKAGFTQLGWEGDCKDGTPKFFGIPDESELDFGCIIKQDNNGSTFVASPIPLPHLQAHHYAELRFCKDDPTRQGPGGKVS